jgi:hypothetical protein
LYFRDSKLERESKGVNAGLLEKEYTIPLLILGHFSRHPYIFFTFPHVRKLFGSLEGGLLLSKMPDKSSGPPMRHFTFLHAIKVWPLEEDLAWLQRPEFSGMGVCKRSSSRVQKTSWACIGVEIFFLLHHNTTVP